MFQNLLFQKLKISSNLQLQWLLSWFEKKVEEFPNHIAIVYKDCQLSYRILNEKANQLAYYLRNQYHIQPDDRVLLCLERNEWLAVAILAVLKSSAAYVPAGDYPGNKVAYMLEDTSAKCAIVSQKYRN